mmetsp:Transcript_1048/g.1924  ORF Transcript_1048/g.1924 Transcript_1048/m.1924 type:complete len:215 (+) Transcript_1048:600-1244(+)
MDKMRPLDPLERMNLKTSKDSALREKIRQDKLAKMEREFLKNFKNTDELFRSESVQVPKIIYLANKAEDGFEGDLLGEFYQHFPHAAEDPDIEPLFISAEHGDGFSDLINIIKNHIPPEKFNEFEERKEKRVTRFQALREQLVDELVDYKISKIEEKRRQENAEEIDSDQDLESFIGQWESDFLFANKDPENNSDFDSDNEINPIDTLQRVDAR